jgi:hypothetical protein
MAFRPILEQLGLPWTPPPVPLQAVVPVVFLLYWTILCGVSFIALEPLHTLQLWRSEGLLGLVISFFCALLGAWTVLGLLSLRVRLKILHGAIVQFSRPAPTAATPPPA